MTRQRFRVAHFNSVRGKKTSALENLAADQDMHCSSLTPSVYLESNVPGRTDKCFDSGRVHVVVNDSVLQTSSAFRHSTVLAKVLARNPGPKVLLRFTDGGTDQRNILMSVQCANICLFIELDLDMLVLARCAPGNSWCNPAERIMSILNLGLQNCALERENTDDVFKSCNSMSDIRSAVSKKPELEEKWVSSIEPVQRVVQNRFEILRGVTRNESIFFRPYYFLDNIPTWIMTKLHFNGLHSPFDQNNCLDLKTYLKSTDQ